MKRIRNLLIFAVLAALTLGALAQKPPRTKLTAAQAATIALKKYPGRVVGKVPLENEDGKWEFAVTIKAGKKLKEVMVDANTGKIASVEVTTAKEESREAAGDKKKGKGG